MSAPDAVIFDFGNVLIRWDPFAAVAVPLGEDEARRFFDGFDFASWNQAQDAGRSWADGLAELERQAPELSRHGRAYLDNFPESLAGGLIEENVALLRELRAHGVRLYGLTNWSSDTYYQRAVERLTFLDALDDVLVSGDVGVVKPDPRIYEIAAERFGVRPSATVFIDDSQPNVDAARQVGFDAVRFTDPDQLRRDLRARDLPV